MNNFERFTWQVLKFNTNGKLLKPLTFCVQCIEDKNTLERKPTVAVKLYDFQELNAELPLVTMKRVLHQMLPPNINYVGNINYHQTTM